MGVPRVSVCVPASPCSRLSSALSRTTRRTTPIGTGCASRAWQQAVTELPIRLAMRTRAVHIVAGAWAWVHVGRPCPFVDLSCALPKMGSPHQPGQRPRRTQAAYKFKNCEWNLGLPEAQRAPFLPWMSPPCVGLNLQAIGWLPCCHGALGCTAASLLSTGSLRHVGGQVGLCGCNQVHHGSTATNQWSEGSVPCMVGTYRAKMGLSAPLGDLASTHSF